MSWMMASNGRVDLDRVNPDQMSLPVIAQSLARIPRYLGHTPRVYSVAEHCLHMCAAAPVHLKIHALLHDAAEAYVGDIIRPVKLMFGAGFAVLEERVLGAIYEHLNVQRPTQYQRAEIDLLDKRMACAEQRHFFPDSEPWPGISELEPLAFAGVFPAQGMATSYQLRVIAWSNRHV